MLGLGALTETPMMLALGEVFEPATSRTGLPPARRFTPPISSRFARRKRARADVPDADSQRVRRRRDFMPRHDVRAGPDAGCLPAAPPRSSYNAARVGSILSGVSSGLLVPGVQPSRHVSLLWLARAVRARAVHVPGYRYPLMREPCGVSPARNTRSFSRSARCAEGASFSGHGTRFMCGKPVCHALNDRDLTSRTTSARRRIVVVTHAAGRRPTQ